jgi:hypothetical protein
VLSAMSSTDFHVEERDGDIIVTCDDFCAVYFKPDAQPQFILRSRTPTNDHASHPHHNVVVLDFDQKFPAQHRCPQCMGCTGFNFREGSNVPVASASVGSLSNRAARKTGAQCLCFW